jgi:hypothetical protein
MKKGRKERILDKELEETCRSEVKLKDRRNKAKKAKEVKNAEAEIILRT